MSRQAQLFDLEALAKKNRVKEKVARNRLRKYNAKAPKTQRIESQHSFLWVFTNKQVPQVVRVITGQVKAA